jgi:hypothetical protein
MPRPPAGLFHARAYLASMKLLPLVLLLATACSPRLHFQDGAFDQGRYSLAGQTTQVPAKAFLNLAGPGGTDEVNIQLNRYPLAVGQGILVVTYDKPGAKPESAYRLRRISYTFNRPADDTAYNVQYNQRTQGTLTRLKGGGYSGTFRGTFNGFGTEGGESSEVVGAFINVLTQVQEKR